MCALNHDAIEWLPLCYRCHKQTDYGRVVVVYIIYTDDLLWRNFLSPQCRNCSRDFNREHAPFRGDFFIGTVGLAMVNQCSKFEVSWFTRYEAMNGSAKCRKWGGLG